MVLKTFEATRSHGRDTANAREFAQNGLELTWAHVSGWAQLSEKFRRVSCVVSCHCTTQNATNLLPTLSDVLTEIGFPWEISVVDTTAGSPRGSSSSWTKIPGFRWVRPESSVSPTAAIWSGMCEMRGDAVVLINACANPPIERLPELTEAWECGTLIATLGRETGLRGFDLESSFRHRHGGPTRKLRPSSLIYGSSNMILLDRGVVNVLALHPPLQTPRDTLAIQAAAVGAE